MKREENRSASFLFVSIFILFSDFPKDVAQLCMLMLMTAVVFSTKIVARLFMLHNLLYFGVDFNLVFL